MRVIVCDGSETYFSLLRTDSHLAHSEGCVWCLQDERVYDDMPEEFRIGGGGRMDCFDSFARLAPEWIAFCRARAMDAMVPWSNRHSYKCT